MTFLKNIAVGALIVPAALMLASCSDKKAVIECTVADFPESEVIVKQLDINRYTILDTVKTDTDGRFSYKVTVREGQPEFVYLFKGERQIVSLLLSSGEKASVLADTLGNYTVTGSPESERLQDVDRAYAEFTAKMETLSARLAELKEDSPEAKAVSGEMAGEYVAYYRDRMKYVLSNQHSLTVVPVLYQTFGNGTPVFSQETDAIFFDNTCDSLESVYPLSPYVKALRQESARRFSNMEFNRKIRTAAQVNYVDIEMPDVNGVRRKLSETDAKVVLIHFWSSSVALHKMFNLEVLQPVYNELKNKGLEIYEVAVETDKGAWARVVRDQGLGWINVCDGLGTSSPVLTSYNISQYPASFLLVNDNLVQVSFTTADEFRRLLRKYL